MLVIVDEVELRRCSIDGVGDSATMAIDPATK